MYKRHLVTIDLVCFGELLWDIYKDGEEKLGGAPFNVAALASLKGIRTLMITAVGNDDKGERLKAAASKKVRLCCETSEHKTGTVEVTVNEGIPSFVIADDVAYDYITFDETMERVCSAAKFLCFGTLAQRRPTSRETLKKIVGKTKAVKIYDFNYREGIGDWESIFAESVKMADILKVNEDELKQLKTLYKNEESDDDTFVKRLIHRHNLRYVFVTRGEKGASLYSEKTVLHRLASECHVVDTTGCGDAFTAGIVYSLINNFSDERMLDCAVELAGRVAEVKGAVPDDASILHCTCFGKVYEDVDFLKRVYEDLKEDLRCRRNFESQHVHYFFLFCAIIGIAIVSLFQTITNYEAYLKGSISIALFITMVTVFLILRVVYDHRQYALIGEIVQKIWRYYGMFTKGAYLEGECILPDGFLDYGKGKGYLYTCALLALTMVGMILFLSALVVIFPLK